MNISQRLLKISTVLLQSPFINLLGFYRHFRSKRYTTVTRRFELTCTCTSKKYTNEPHTHATCDLLATNLIICPFHACVLWSTYVSLCFDVAQSADACSPSPAADREDCGEVTASWEHGWIAKSAKQQQWNACTHHTPTGQVCVPHVNCVWPSTILTSFPSCWDLGHTDNAHQSIHYQCMQWCFLNSIQLLFPVPHIQASCPSHGAVKLACMWWCMYIARTQDNTAWNCVLCARKTNWRMRAIDGAGVCVPVHVVFSFCSIISEQLNHHLVVCILYPQVCTSHMILWRRQLRKYVRTRSTKFLEWSEFCMWLVHLCA